MPLSIHPLVVRKKLGKHVLSSEESGDWNILVNGLVTKVRTTFAAQRQSIWDVGKNLEENPSDTTLDDTLSQLKAATLAVLETSVYESFTMNRCVEKQEGTLGMGLTGVNTVSVRNRDDRNTPVAIKTFYLPGRNGREAARELPTSWRTLEPEILEHMIYSQCYLRSVRNLHRMAPMRNANRAACCDLSRLIPLPHECQFSEWSQQRQNCRMIGGR